MRLELGPALEAALLAAARESIASALERRPPSWPAAADGAAEPCGAFVSLHVGRSLRGCIGRMTSPEPLYETVREMARAAAFEDPRFTPVSREELDSIDIEITALSPMRRVEEVSEIEVGLHGIHIQKGWRSGVFLPQVAVEQGWDRDTLLEEVCRKAGLPAEAWRSPDAVISVFEGLVFGEADSPS